MLAVLAESALRSLLLGGIVWVGLKILRVRNPHLQMTCWIMVLVVSLAMPLLMHWTTVTVTLEPLPAPASHPVWAAELGMDGPLLELLTPSASAQNGLSRAGRGETHQAINWWAVATAIYGLVAGMLLLRLVVGIRLTWRLVRAARPLREAWISEAWAGNADVRVSDHIGGPVTFGSTILVPPQCSDWDPRKRQAVLAHEGAHVANRDFHVLLLASLHRAVFWFNPFAWWQLTRLAELAEIISDARALEVVQDRVSYAEILLDLVQHGRPAAGLQMARACTVRARVERILGLTALPARVGWRKRIGAAAVIVPIAIVAAGSIATSRPQPAMDAVDEAAAVTGRLQRVGFYALNPISILAISREGDDWFGQLTGQRRLHLSAAPDGTYAYAAVSGPISFAIQDEPQPSELTLRQNGRDVRAARIAELRGQATAVNVDASALDSYVGWYQLAPNRILCVMRDGNRIQVRETGRPGFAVAARGDDAFVGKHDALVIFLRDGQAKVNQVLVQEPTLGARLAPRIDAGSANRIEAAFARQIAEAPDHFKDQTPTPGAKEAVLRGLEAMQRGVVNDDRMSAPLAATLRRQGPQLKSMFKAFGAVQSIFFRGVGPGGYDIYGVKFANGFAELRILLAADGKVDDVLFRPDGNDAPGRLAACSEEPNLSGRGDAVPIKVLLYNDSGTDIQVHRLDPQGKRVIVETLGENTLSWILTTVDNPWILTDVSGHCLEIILAGQRTRYHTVEAPQTTEQSQPRAVPLTGSEDMLREYIAGVSRGEPNYDHMTMQVAAQTRRDLALHQAILGKLGALRAVSFRGATGMGMDAYMAHFSNGSAEWRIGLLKDGSIGRIALGPQ
jgi:beta-lactamase regulating signal transducer with metallopeptidase domain